MINICGNKILYLDIKLHQNNITPIILYCSSATLASTTIN